MEGIPKNNMTKELNIHFNNLDFIDNLSDTSDANESNADESNVDEPIIVKSPVIQIKQIGNSAPNTTLNLLQNRQNHSFPDDENCNTNRTQKLSSKIKSKSKSKEKAVKLKNKFSETTLEFISEELKGKIFSGWIGEREYVENLRAYRDIVEIDEWEEDLNKKLKIVMTGVKGVMEGTKWINITVPSSHSPSYCLWVLFESVPCPGHYWMQVADISSDSTFGLKISLKILREVNSFDGESKEMRERRQKGGDLSPDEWKEWALSLINFDLKDLFAHTLTVFTPTNIGNGFRLLVVLTVTLVVAMVTFMKHSWEFLLRLLRELGIFIHHATPFAQSVIQFFEKIVGGFYLLLAMVYNDFRRPKGPSLPMGGMHHHGPPISPRPVLPPIAYVPANNWVFHEDDTSD